MYIHIEGMDLAGKSTASNAVRSKLGINTQIRHNTIQTKSNFHKIVDNLRLSKRANSEELGVLYLQVLKDDISRFQPPEAHTIQDSTIILRSIAWYCAQGNPLANEFISLLPTHPVFTRSIVLTASIKARQYRLQCRINEAPETVAIDDMMVIDNPDLFLKMEESLIEHSTSYFNSVVIDTTDLTKSEVSKKACSILLA
jgi:hypothetical protein